MNKAILLFVILVGSVNLFSQVKESDTLYLKISSVAVEICKTGCSSADGQVFWGEGIMDYQHYILNPNLEEDSIYNFYGDTILIFNGYLNSQLSNELDSTFRVSQFEQKSFYFKKQKKWINKAYKSRKSKRRFDGYLYFDIFLADIVCVRYDLTSIHMMNQFPTRKNKNHVVKNVVVYEIISIENIKSK